MLSTFETCGDALRIRTTCPTLADWSWQQRAELTRLAGAQRLELLVALEGDELRLQWTPPPPPWPTTTTTTRRRRRP